MVFQSGTILVILVVRELRRPVWNASAANLPAYAGRFRDVCIWATLSSPSTAACCTCSGRCRCIESRSRRAGDSPRLHPFLACGGGLGWGRALNDTAHLYVRPLPSPTPAYRERGKRGDGE